MYFFLISNEDTTDIQVISEHIISQSTKIYSLVDTNGYYLSKGFINGELYYIFETNDLKSDKGYETALASNSDFVYDNKKNVQVTEMKVIQEYKPNFDIFNIVKNRTITKYHYTFHVPDNKIKDYGVIKEEIKQNNDDTIWPIFIPIYTH